VKDTFPTVVDVINVDTASTSIKILPIRTDGEITIVS
jgi:hypothetical protein